MNRPFTRFPAYWRGPFALYRDVVGPTTEASDNFHFVCSSHSRAAIGGPVRLQRAASAERQAVLIGKRIRSKSTSMTRARMLPVVRSGI